MASENSIHGMVGCFLWHRFADRLREQGVSCRLIELPWASHAFDLTSFDLGAMVSTSAVLDFLKEATREKAQ